MPVKAKPPDTGKPPNGGGKPNKGELAVTDPGDVLAFTGSITVGSVEVSGTLAVIEARDVAAMAGTLPPIASALLLALLTGAGDSTPDFNLTGDLQIGDVIRFQWDNVNTFSSGALGQSNNSINATEDAARTLDFATGELANGTWYFRARVERGATIFGWSNIESLTISIPPARSIFQQPGAPRQMDGGPGGIGGNGST